MITVSHYGDLGDLIYHFAVIAYLTQGEADVVLYPCPANQKGKTVVREPFTIQKVLKCISFLELQPYVRRVRFEPKPEGIILDEWRRRYKPRHTLIASCAHAFRQPVWHDETPWMRADDEDENTRGKALIHRSPRYPGREYPWKEVVGFLGSDALFVGSREEHEDFTKQFGFVQYYETPTLLTLARAIAGCRMFFGNQSTPRAVAEALKRPVFVEESWEKPNTKFKRPGAFYWESPRVSGHVWKDVQHAWACSWRDNPPPANGKVEYVFD